MSNQRDLRFQMNIAQAVQEAKDKTWRQPIVLRDDFLHQATIIAFNFRWAYDIELGQSGDRFKVWFEYWYADEFGWFQTDRRVDGFPLKQLCEAR